MFMRHGHKCLHCAGIESATSCVVGEYSHHYATSAVKSVIKREWYVCMTGVRFQKFVVFYKVIGPVMDD
jgi:hypothetical protein